MINSLLLSKQIAAIEKRFLDKRSQIEFLIQKYGSPFYLYDKSQAKNTIRDFRETFGGKDQRFQIFYAVKANPYPSLLKELIRQGVGLEVSSIQELELAQKLNAKSILFSGPGKSESELQIVIGYYPMVTLMIDSQSELHKVAKLIKSNKQPLSIGVRISTTEKAKLNWQHFGIPLTELPDCFTNARAQGLTITGLQIHSSQNIPEIYGKRIHILSQLLKKLSLEDLRDLDFIDLGGGFPGLGSLESYFKAINKAHRLYLAPLKKLNYYLEPGKALSQSAFHLVSTIRDIKNNTVVCDLGINAVGRKIGNPLIINLTSPSLTPKQRLITGPLCSPEDVWGTQIFAKQLKENDILLMPYQGHYTYSLAQNFIRPIPPVLTLK